MRSIHQPTMPVEVQAPNNDAALLPGVYAQIGLSSARAEAPLLMPGDVVREGVKVSPVPATQK